MDKETNERYVNIEPLEQYLRREEAKDQIEFRELLYRYPPWILLAISILLMFLIINQSVEINLINKTLYFILLLIPTFLLLINYVVFLLPFVEKFLNKKHRYSITVFPNILKEHKNPTQRIYKIRKVIMVTLTLLGFLLFLSNIVLFIIETIY